MLALALLMVSRLPHPAITWVFLYRWAYPVYALVLLAAIFLLRLPLISLWFLINVSYLTATVLRAGVRRLSEAAGSA